MLFNKITKTLIEDNLFLPLRDHWFVLLEVKRLSHDGKNVINILLLIKWGDWTMAIKIMTEKHKLEAYINWTTTTKTILSKHNQTLKCNIDLQVFKSAVWEPSPVFFLYIVSSVFIHNMDLHHGVWDQQVVLELICSVDVHSQHKAVKYWFLWYIWLSITSFHFNWKGDIKINFNDINNNNEMWFGISTYVQCFFFFFFFIPLASVLISTSASWSTSSSWSLLDQTYRTDFSLLKWSQ